MEKQEKLYQCSMILQELMIFANRVLSMGIDKSWRK